MPEPYNVKTPFGEFPMERWQAKTLGAVAIVAALVTVLVQLIPVWKMVMTPAQVDAQLAAEMAEYQEHMGEMPETAYASPDSNLRVQVYKDFAVLIVRKDGSRSWTRIIPDLAKNKTPQQAALPSLIEPVQAFDECQPRHVHRDPPRGPQWGQPNGCYVQAFWTYADGCAFFQLYDRCRGVFEANPNGTPRYHWYSCR